MGNNSNNAIAGTIQSVIGTLKVAPPSHEVQQAVSVLEALKEKTIRVGAEYDQEIAHLQEQVRLAQGGAQKAAGAKVGPGGAWPVHVMVPAKPLPKK